MNSTATYRNENVCKSVWFPVYLSFFHSLSFQIDFLFQRFIFAQEHVIHNITAGSFLFVLLKNEKKRSTKKYFFQHRFFHVTMI